MTIPRDHVHSGFGGEVQPDDIAPYILMPTDASQVEQIVARLENARQLTHHYEFLIYSGEYAGTLMTLCSTGLGGMSVSIAVEELARLGATTFLQMGIADSQDDQTAEGELIIAKGAARFDGTSLDYARPEYPALASFEIVMAAIAAAEQASLSYRVEVVSSLASSAPSPAGQFSHFHTNRINPVREALRQAGVVSGSGQEATLFIQAALYGFRAGAIVVGPQGKSGAQFDDAVITTSLEAVRVLAAWDNMKTTTHLPYITPEVL